MEDFKQPKMNENQSNGKQSGLYKFLTYVMYAALIIGLIPTISIFGYMPSGIGGPAAGGIIFGNLIAYLTIPGIIWVIRHFVGK